MIDPKELRLLNLVQTPKGIEAVAEVGFGNIGFKPAPPIKSEYVINIDGCWNNYEPKQIDPIPITPEWLERLFDVSADDLMGRSGCCLCEILPDIWLRYNDYGTGEILIEEYREGAVRIPHIRYVHQLQNLYFALTGEELKVKEESQSNVLPQVGNKQGG